MGVGVYRSTLQSEGLGAGFGVRSALLLEPDADELDGIEEWDDIADSIRWHANQVGASQAKLHGEGGTTAFNRDMLTISAGSHFVVGAMPWQHDFVIEVGSPEWLHEWLLCPPHEQQVRDVFGAPMERVRRALAEYHRRLARYLALGVMERGYWTWPPVGGWMMTLEKPRGGAGQKWEKRRLKEWLVRRAETLMPEVAHRRHRCFGPRGMRGAA